MGIRAKLFLWVGFLILFVTILMFLLPTYFVKKDVLDAIGRVQSLIRQEQQELENNQEAWLKEKIQQLQGNINALLFLINESNGLSDSLSFNRNEGKIWSISSHLLAFNPDLGLVQIHDPEKNKLFAVLSQGVPLYNVRSSAINEKISLLKLSEGGNASFYIGFLLNPSGQTEFQEFALIDWDEASDELKDLLEIIEKAKPDLQQPSEAFSREVKNLRIAEARWADKVTMIETLAPLYGTGLTLSKDGKPHIPVGIAHVHLDGKGEAILSREVFRIKGLFDDVEYYQKNHSASDESPIAKGKAIIIDPLTEEIFIGNTLKIGPTYLTVGGSLNAAAKGLALISNREVLFSVEGKWKGFSANGEAFTKSQLEKMSSFSLNERHGTLTLGSNTYFFSRLTPLPSIDFYILTPQEKERSILGTLLNLDRELTEKISYQLLYVMLASLVVALLILERLSLSITKPITQLAKATENVSGGNYSEIVLPKMGHRKDEIATLTNAFEEMVKGLEEREKIRGVLNKVVSKDVADEILKSSIHLGGEDRIVTMLFSDIRNFTKSTENLPPQKTIQMLNEYMTKMFRVIEGEGGVIDKYVGDEIMAIYGAPTSYPDHAIRALSAAKLMIETLKKWNNERSQAGESPIEMGIGIHTGLVVAGNMGAEDRLNYTVIGANVNLAARLCQVAKPMQILISEHTLKQPSVKDWFYVKPLESISLKGFTDPVMIYEIVGFKWLEEG